MAFSVFSFMGTEFIAAPPFGAYIACATIFLFRLAILAHPINPGDNSLVL